VCVETTYKRLKTLIRFDIHKDRKTTYKHVRNAYKICLHKDRKTTYKHVRTLLARDESGQEHKGHGPLPTGYQPKMSLGQHGIFVEGRLAPDESNHRVTYQLVTHTDVFQSVYYPLPFWLFVYEVLDVTTHIRKGCSRGVVVNAGAPRADEEILVR